MASRDSFQLKVDPATTVLCAFIHCPEGLPQGMKFRASIETRVNGKFDQASGQAFSEESEARAWIAEQILNHKPPSQTG